MTIKKVKNEFSTQTMRWSIQDIPWNRIIVVVYWYKMLLFRRFQSIIFFVKGQSKWPIAEIKLSFEMYTQLINMNLDKGMVIKKYEIYTLTITALVIIRSNIWMSSFTRNTLSKLPMEVLFWNIYLTLMSKHSSQAHGSQPKKSKKGVKRMIDLLIISTQFSTACEAPNIIVVVNSRA
jgi:hypothetical protein